MLKPMYQLLAATEVFSSMPLAAISGVKATSPRTPVCTAWSKLSELMPEASYQPWRNLLQ